jgi:putative protein-disulfide isomerase
MEPTIYYCYDAYCGWCYGFSNVIKKIADEFKSQVFFEVLSGGMIPPEFKQHISKTASYIKGAYKQVEALSGITFGEDYLWHINDPQESDWYPESLTPAIALCIFKEYHPDKAVAMAADLQYALHAEGRDLTDDEAYRHLLEKYKIPAADFYKKMHSEEYIEKAKYEFALVKQLQVTGFPALLMQVTDSKFYLLAKGFTNYDTLKKRIDKILMEINSNSQ